MSVAAKSKGLALVESIREGMKRERPVNFPGTDRALGVLVPLLCDDLQSASASAHLRFKELGVEIGLYSGDDYWSECNLQLLYRSLRDPQDRSRKLFASADELRQALTPDERTELVSEYLELQDECNPAPERVSDRVLAEMDELVKKKDAIRLKGFGSSRLAAYLIFTADQRASSVTGSSDSMQSDSE